MRYGYVACMNDVVIQRPQPVVHKSLIKLQTDEQKTWKRGSCLPIPLSTPLTLLLKISHNVILLFVPFVITTQILPRGY